MRLRSDGFSQKLLFDLGAMHYIKKSKNKIKFGIFKRRKV